MPAIVSQGRKPDVFACGFCHRADGPGGPKNSSLAGLPAVYIVQQIADFKSGARTTSVLQRNPPKLMNSLAKAATAAEVEAAAAYFFRSETAIDHAGRRNRYGAEDLCHWRAFGCHGNRGYPFKPRQFHDFSDLAHQSVCVAEVESRHRRGITQFQKGLETLA